MSGFDFKYLHVDKFEHYVRDAIKENYKPFRRVGYRWHDPGDKPLTLEGIHSGEISYKDPAGRVHDILFFTDDPQTWFPSWLKGATLYKLDFCCHNPKSFAVWPTPFEWFGGKDYDEWRHRGFDVVTYTPSKELNDPGTRQAILLKPREQVVRVEKIFEIVL